jgi:fructose-1,6-bisphosphatase I
MYLRRALHPGCVCQQIGEFILTHPDIRIPRRGKIYSFNEANRWDWDKPLQEYVTALQTGQGETGKCLW